MSFAKATEHLLRNLHELDPQMDAVVETSANGSRAIVRIRGSFTVDEAGPVHQMLADLSSQQDLKYAELDFSRVAAFDSAGAAVVSLAQQRFRQQQRRLEVSHLSEAHRAAFQLMPQDLPSPGSPMKAPLLERIGAWGMQTSSAAMDFAGLIVDTVWTTIGCLAGRKRARIDAALQQAVIMGADAVVIVGLLSVVLGLVLTFQTTLMLARQTAGRTSGQGRPDRAC